jgi:exodeoxyribonuclease VII small subunit
VLRKTAGLAMINARGYRNTTPAPQPRSARPGQEIRVTEPKPDIATMPCEAALAELEQIVDQLEKGAVSLDDSIRLYERGEALKTHCDELLKSAEMRIDKITLNAAGKPKGIIPLDGD